ncbi:arsenical resistance operon trans-acting repressor ArsD [Peptococcaceae bacterium CEB3]|nr:arsenical resistance operon trans-acting repressor ArsD [Peptococcaceae bacterium CEB3]
MSQMRLEFFEAPMCCSTGICGPSVDERLVRLNENIQVLQKKYPAIQVERYQISRQPLKFKDNEEVFVKVKEQGQRILPLTAWNGKVVKEGQYPELGELEQICQGGSN